MILKVSGLRFSYGHKEKVLRGLTFGMEEGSIYTLLGGSGSGKTTILKVIAGFIKPHRGSVEIRGRDVTGLPPEKRGIGFVFQHYALFPHMNVRSNIEYGYRIRQKGQEKIIKELMEMLGLEGLDDRLPAELSGGQMQRVALARALATEPDLLLMDEPLSALDASLRSGLRKELRSILNEKGISALYVTHDQEEALDLSDRIGVLERGRIIEEGAPREIYWRPRRTFTADFLGFRNILPVLSHRRGSIETEFGRIPWRRRVPGYIGFRPQTVGMSGEGIKVKGKVLRTTYRGSDLLVEFDVNGRSIFASMADDGISLKDELDLIIPYRSIVPLTKG